jgi:hypothetical protein
VNRTEPAKERAVVIESDGGNGFVGGYPRPATVQRAHDEADLNRASYAPLLLDLRAGPMVIEHPRALFDFDDVGDATSVDLYFGPTAPSAQEHRWVPTLPGAGWFTYFRIYGPEASALDGTWQLDDITAI